MGEIMSGLDIFDIISLAIAASALIISSIINGRSLKIARNTLDTRFDASLSIEYDKENEKLEISNEGYGVAYNVRIEIISEAGEVFHTRKIKSVLVEKTKSTTYHRETFLYEFLYRKKKRKLKKIDKERSLEETVKQFINLSLEKRKTFYLATIYYEDVQHKTRKIRFRVFDFPELSSMIDFSVINESRYRKEFRKLFRKIFEDNKLKMKQQ